MMHRPVALATSAVVFVLVAAASQWKGTALNLQGSVGGALREGGPSLGREGVFRPPVPVGRRFGRMVLVADSLGQATTGVSYHERALELLHGAGYEGVLSTYVRPGSGLRDWYRQDLQEVIRNESALNSTAFVLQIGINDALKQLSPAHTLSLYWDLVRYIRVVAPDAAIVVMTVTPCDIFGPRKYSEWTHQVNVGLSEIAASYRCILAPVGEDFLDMLHVAKANASDFFEDIFCHPNGRGKLLMAGTLVRSIRNASEGVVEVSTSGTCHTLTWCGYVLEPLWADPNACDENARVSVSVSADGSTLRFGRLPVDVVLRPVWATRALAEARNATLRVTVQLSSGTEEHRVVGLSTRHAQVLLRAGTAQAVLREAGTDALAFVPYHTPVARAANETLAALSNANATWTLPPVQRSVAGPVRASSGGRVAFIVDGVSARAGLEWHAVAGAAVAALRSGGWSNTTSAGVHVLDEPWRWAGERAQEVVAAEWVRGTRVFVVSVGLREALRGVSVGLAAAHYRHMVRMMRWAAPDAALVLATVPPCRTHSLVHSTWLAQLNVAIAEVAVTYRCLVADTATALHEALRTHTASVDHDTLDLDEDAQLLVARRVADALLSPSSTYGAASSCGALYFCGYLLQPQWASPRCDENPTVRFSIGYNGSNVFAHSIPVAAALYPSWAGKTDRMPVYGKYQFTLLDAQETVLANYRCHFGQVNTTLLQGTARVYLHMYSKYRYKGRGKRRR